MRTKTRGTSDRVVDGTREAKYRPLVEFRPARFPKLAGASKSRDGHQSLITNDLTRTSASTGQDVHQHGVRFLAGGAACGARDLPAQVPGGQALAAKSRRARPPSKCAAAHLALGREKGAAEHARDRVVQVRMTSSSGSTPCSSASSSPSPRCNPRYPSRPYPPHLPPTHRAPNHAAHGAAPALARVRPITAAALPCAPQEEREDLLDVLAQELRRARVPPLSQPRPKPNTLTVTPTPNPPTSTPSLLAQELASAVHTELRGRTYTKVRARDRDRVRGDRRVRR